ncbi:hypothetical protein [Nocardia caishijiensis]|uniref:Uncharacterized protein n=1 Tax=Nocardia caishijiensis TaxID=184756 RepID=A0ABQ6YJN5_9NOCA|nr:hypothetical protein [Nocardia caishijiensis]KAF0845995.1 hypothetical protein FNL39_106390 [Nocardia caishijiensis]
MLHIKLTEAVPAEDPTDPLERDFYGWDPNRSLEENWRSNRGYYALGTRADREQYVLFSYNKTGRIVMAARIDGIVDAVGRPGRRIIAGELLDTDHPVWQAYVGDLAPAKSRSARNPITYDDDTTPGFGRPCRCGCGTEIFGAVFVSGHDQAALHQRVAMIGTIPEFLDWFDAVMAGNTESDRTQTTVLRTDGQLVLSVRTDGGVDLTFAPSTPAEAKERGRL